jgi:hypothetical protein
MTSHGRRGLLLGCFAVAACNVQGWEPDRNPPADAGSFSAVDACDVALPASPGADAGTAGCPACGHYAVRPVASVPVGTDDGLTCLVDENDILTLSYETSMCPSVRPYRGCEVANHQDFSAFDSGDGVLQAEVCLDGPLTDSINLWYEASPEVRKYMTLASPGSATGCRIVFLSPEDACYIENVCGPGCAQGDGGVSEVDGGCPIFSDSRVVLMSEWCACSAAGCPQPASMVARLLSLSYYSNGCLCRSDADCTDPQTVCRKDAWPDGARCHDRVGDCPGVCLL